MNDIFLSPFSLFYRAVVRARAAFYERGIFKSHSLGAFTLSIGNITVGGTGKTPLVAYAARILDENGERVCILTRGYKRENPGERVLVSDGEKILVDARKAGDEPFELACKLIGVSAIVADRNRVEAGNWARENLGITAFVLDDAFQHRRARRDLDIVCIDATNPFGSGKILPAGILREPLSNLKRADAVVITRANLVEAKRIADLKSRISEINPRCKIFVSENKISNLIILKKFSAAAAASEPPAAAGALTLQENSPPINTGTHGFETENQISDFKFQNADRKINFAAADETGEQRTTGGWRRATGNYLAFCALGNPESFFEQLRREKFDLVLTQAFRDHHRYTQRDIDELEKKAAASGAQNFLTTAKDAVKLKDLQFNLPCYVAESELIFDDEKSFRELIAGAARKKSAAKECEKNTKKI